MDRERDPGALPRPTFRLPIRGFRLCIVDFGFSHRCGCTVTFLLPSYGLRRNVGRKKTAKNGRYGDGRRANSSSCSCRLLVVFFLFLSMMMAAGRRLAGLMRFSMQKSDDPIA